MDLVKYLAIAVALGLGIMSIVLHEVAHAFVAWRLGDETAHEMGRVSLNPVRHVDPFMTILLPILLYAMSKGAFIFGGAKPVPVNVYNFRRPARDFMLTSLAGPATNLAIMLVCALLLRVPFLSGAIPGILFRVGTWNLGLVVFNLIPIPPLDGSRVVMYLLPRGALRRYESVEPYGIFIVAALSTTTLLDPVFVQAYRLFFWLAGVPL